MVELVSCKSTLERFNGKRILVLGDLMLDEHIWGTVARISPEAPVMVIDVDSPDSDCRPGGAANVANNLRALGAKVSVVGVIGDDEGGRILTRSLEESGVDVSGVFVDKNRPTTRKTRFWASHRHQIVRVDRESKKKVTQTTARKMMDFVRQRVEDIDAVLLSDYGKGVITRETAASAIHAADELGIVSASNAKPVNIHCFNGIGVITVNQSEASAASGVEIEDREGVEKAGAKLQASTHCRGLVITRGAHGLCVFNSEGKATHVPAVESEVYDVAGAGDTVVSALSLALAAGADLPTSAAIANCAGGAVVRKVGVATTSVAEISELLSMWLAKQGKLQPQV